MINRVLIYILGMACLWCCICDQINLIPMILINQNEEVGSYPTLNLYFLNQTDPTSMPGFRIKVCKSIYSDQSALKYGIKCLLIRCWLKNRSKLELFTRNSLEFAWNNITVSWWYISEHLLDVFALFLL